MHLKIIERCPIIQKGYVNIDNRLMDGFILLYCTTCNLYAYSHDRQIVIVQGFILV